MGAGVALNPASPASAVAHVLGLCRLVLVMTVNPGWGGQSYLPAMESKVAEVRAMIDEGGHDVELEVDGGIGRSTIGGVAGAGAGVFVAGSAVFSDELGFNHAIDELREAAAHF